MINSYLRELVQNNHRVIIPDFGAFLKKDKAATALENSVTFSPFLRFNDGLLEDYLVDKEHVTKEVASVKVRQYVQDIKQTIAEERPFYVDDLGAFYEDERGSVQFLFAGTEKEARRKFDDMTAKTQPSASMPELEVEVPVAQPVVEEVVEVAPAPVVEEKKVPAKKKIVEVVEDEEEEDADVEEVKTVSVRGRKKADVKEAKKKETKDNNAVSKTIINVNVNTDKDKEEVRAEEKAKQLEVANSSLQRWMEEVERRKEQQSMEEKKVLETQVHATQEELEAQRRRQEEIERALTEKKRRDEEEARRKAEEEEAAKAREVEREREAALSAKLADEEESSEDEDEQHQPLPAVWEEEVIERKKGSRGAVLLLLVLLLVLAVAGVLWFWTPISESLGWQSEYELSDEVLMDSYYTQPAKPKTVLTPAPVVPPVAKSVLAPAVASQQPGMYYVVVGTFNLQNNAIVFCQTLSKLGFKPEIVKTDSDKFAISIGKYNNMDAAQSALVNYKQKHGNAFILY